MIVWASLRGGCRWRCLREELAEGAKCLWRCWCPTAPRRGGPGVVPRWEAPVPGVRVGDLGCPGGERAVTGREAPEPGIRVGGLRRPGGGGRWSFGARGWVRNARPSGWMVMARGAGGRATGGPGRAGPGVTNAPGREVLGPGGGVAPRGNPGGLSRGRSKPEEEGRGGGGWSFGARGWGRNARPSGWVREARAALGKLGARWEPGGAPLGGRRRRAAWW